MVEGMCPIHYMHDADAEYGKGQLPIVRYCTLVLYVTPTMFQLFPLKGKPEIF